MPKNRGTGTARRRHGPHLREKDASGACGAERLRSSRAFLLFASAVGNRLRPSGTGKKAALDAGLRQLLNALELFLQAVARFNEVFRHLQKKPPVVSRGLNKNRPFWWLGRREIN